MHDSHLPFNGQGVYAYTLVCIHYHHLIRFEQLCLFEGRCIGTLIRRQLTGGFADQKIRLIEL